MSPTPITVIYLKDRRTFTWYERCLINFRRRFTCHSDSSSASSPAPVSSLPLRSSPTSPSSGQE
jgi:hypothetical protein